MNKQTAVEKVCIVEVSGAKIESKTLRNKILSATDPLLERKIKHYISENGNDNNDGLSPETALKSFSALKRCDLYPGHAVLFERGGTFRFDSSIVVNGGVYYGAYGNGPKPKLLGSVEDYADAEKWTNYENDVWMLSLPLSSAGMMNFNNDSYIGVRKKLYTELLKDGDYYHDIEGGKLYLKLSDGNPGEVFDNIEIATSDFLFQLYNVNNVTIDNVCIKYVSRHGIKAADVSDITIKNCEIGWIGGIYINEDSYKRFGNAIELWYKAENVCVNNCWIYQAFDAAFTFQGDGPRITTFKDIRCEGNLIEYCSMNFEYWVRHFDENRQRVAVGFMHSIRFCDNILRFAGYGWGGKQRYSKPDQAFLLCWDNVFREDMLRDFYIMDNVFDIADCNMVYAATPEMQSGLYVSHNRYYQTKPTGNNTRNQIIRILDIYATNQTEFEYAIKKFDSKPDDIRWIDN
mgnify:CR=1 FL=1